MIWHRRNRNIVDWATKDLASAEAGVRAIRRLGKRDLTLTFALIRLAQRRAEAELLEDALAALDEAVAICRRRSAEGSSGFETNLALALYLRAVQLTRCRKWEEGLASAEQAVELYRRLVREDQNRYEPVFTGALKTLGDVLYFAGRLEDAVRAFEEAITIGRRLAAATAGEHEQFVADAVHNRRICLDELTRQVAEQAEPGEVVLGPYPLCDQCKKVNGGLVAVQHRQVHVTANGRQSCVDQQIADIVAALWRAGCDTTSSCEDEDGRAYVYTVLGHVAAAERCLVDLGLAVESDRGALYFPLPRTLETP